MTVQCTNATKGVVGVQGRKTFAVVNTIGRGGFCSSVDWWSKVREIPDHSVGHTDTDTDTHTHRQRHTQTHTHTHTQTHTHACTHRHTHRHTDTQTHRHTDTHTHSQEHTMSM